jgi:predicted outer membrane repeat protein
MAENPQPIQTYRARRKMTPKQLVNVLKETIKNLKMVASIGLATLVLSGVVSGKSVANIYYVNSWGNTGNIIYVDNDAHGANNGSSWQDAYGYLQDALADANISSKPVEIRVAQGDYKPDQGGDNIIGDRTATFQLINGVTLNGGYAGFGKSDPNVRDIKLYETILSGDLGDNDKMVNNPLDLLYDPKRADNSYHVIIGNNTNMTAILDGFVITGGNANASVPEIGGNGGGMYNEFGSPTVINCIFRANSAYYGGGGMFNYKSNPIVINCLFRANSAGEFSGGGICNHKSSLTLTECVFIGNSASYGGGFYNSQSTTKLTNCTFEENSAFQGGGIFCFEDNSIITQSIFFDNSASYEGGAIYCGEISNSKVTNCILNENSANEGGGIYSYYYSNPTLTNCLLNRNKASHSGAGGVYCDSLSSAKISNSIIWDNSDFELDGSAMVSYSNIQGGWQGIGNIDVDPLFADTENGDYHLKSQAGRWDPKTNEWVKDDVTSPCIDAGDPSSPIMYEPFPNGGRINMGAYGGTLEASKSYFGEPTCETIVAGDINGDCKVNLEDFAIMAGHWLEDRKLP